MLQDHLHLSLCALNSKSRICNSEHFCRRCRCIFACAAASPHPLCQPCLIIKGGSRWTQAKPSKILTDIRARDKGCSLTESNVHCIATSPDSESSTCSVPSLGLRLDPSSHGAIRSLCEDLIVRVSEPSVVAASVAPASSSAVPSSMPPACLASAKVLDIAVCSTDLIHCKFPSSAVLNVRERLAAFAPSVDLHFQHFSNHSLQTCWKVPCWFNCAKGTGLGVMVQLFILAAQLRYSHSEAASAQGAHAELAAIVRALKPLHKASEVKGRDLDTGMKQQIKTVECLFERSDMNVQTKQQQQQQQQQQQLFGSLVLVPCLYVQQLRCKIVAQTSGSRYGTKPEAACYLSFESLSSHSWEQIQAFSSSSTVKAFMYLHFLFLTQIKRSTASSLVKQTEQFVPAIANKQ